MYHNKDLTTIPGHIVWDSGTPQTIITKIAARAYLRLSLSASCFVRPVPGSLFSALESEAPMEHFLGSTTVHSVYQA